MGRREDLIAAARTANAPTVQEANPVRPPVKSPNAMSLEEFMRRNPHAIDRDAEKKKEEARKKQRIERAQAAQGQRPNSGPGNRPRNGRPNIRDTERSLRDDPRKSVPYGNNARPPLTRAQSAIMSNDILREALKKLLPQ
jgi:hypothetical protein